MRTVKLARSNADALGSARALACSFRRPRRNIPLSELLKVRDPESVRGRQVAAATATLQSAGTTERVCRRDAHPAISPTPHLRVRTALLFHSTPSSNSVDRK